MTDDTPDSLPYAPAVPTSRQAAQEALPAAATLREAIYRHVEALGSQGATEDEIAAALQLGRPSSTSAVAWLKARNRLAYAGHTRHTRTGHRAQVLVAMPADRWRDAPEPAPRKRFYAVRLDPATKALETRGPFGDAKLRDAQLKAMAAADGQAVLYGLDADDRGRLSVGGPIHATPPPPASGPPAGFLFDTRASATEKGL